MMTRQGPVVFVYSMSQTVYHKVAVDQSLQKTQWRNQSVCVFNVRKQQFSSQSGLCQHMNIHKGKYKCTECGKCCK